jgi:hypothetical protein
MSKTQIGDKQTFAFETCRYRDCSPRDFQTVDIYVAGKRITVQDNTAFVPQFLGSIDASRTYLKRDISWLQYRDELDGMNLTEAHLYLAKRELSFLHWGPTTDDVSSQLIVFQNSLWITAFLYSENQDWETN